jgi:MarR family transcriptional regulator, organic hydroperoxide resistance regulator
MTASILVRDPGRTTRGEGKGHEKIIDISIIDIYTIFVTAARLTVSQEIKQSRPFASRAHEGAVGLLLTADLLRRRLAAVVEPHGITPQQYNVLRILRGAGPDGLPTLEVAERMVEKAPGITRLVDRLEAAGLVERRRVATDRRQVRCVIGNRGLELLAALDAPIRAADESIGVLLPADVDRLVELLDTLRERWRALDAPPGPDGPKGR